MHLETKLTHRSKEFGLGEESWLMSHITKIEPLLAFVLIHTSQSVCRYFYSVFVIVLPPFRMSFDVRKNFLVCKLFSITVDEL